MKETNKTNRLFNLPVRKGKFKWETSGIEIYAKSGQVPGKSIYKRMILIKISTQYYIQKRLSNTMNSPIKE